MPNKRDKGKVGITFFVKREIRDMARDELRKRNKTMTAFLEDKLLGLVNIQADSAIVEIKKSKRESRS